MAGFLNKKTLGPGGQTRGPRGGKETENGIYTTTIYPMYIGNSLILNRKFSRNVWGILPHGRSSA